MTAKLTHRQQNILYNQRNACNIYDAKELKYHINTYWRTHTREALRTRAEHYQAILLFGSMLSHYQREASIKQIYKDAS